MSKYIVFIGLVACFLSSLGTANESLIVAVGNAEYEADRLLVQNPALEKVKLPKELASALAAFLQVIENDFAFYRKLFQVMPAHNHPTFVKGPINYSEWENRKIVYLFRPSFELRAEKLILTLSLTDIRKKQEIYSETVALHNGVNLRRLAHLTAEKFYQLLVGKESIFTTKILFVSNFHNRKVNGKKELYWMDFDGNNKQQLTFHNGLVISPAISNNGKQVVYSLIRDEKNRNVNLYWLDLETKQNKLLSNRPGLNSGAVFTPNDDKLLLTLSHQGNARIYEMNLQTKQLRPVTNNFSEDVDPSINQDGSIMAFLSNRPGKAMIYLLDPSGTEKNVRRIGFVGKFNATPRFAPDGKEIAFASWIDERFDIVRINADGTGLTRLTKDFGSNEDPTYSNDGQFIAFSSMRVLSSKQAGQEIYIMDREGEIIGPITDNYGNCIGPRWSKSLK